MGETWETVRAASRPMLAFSILERIDVGETNPIPVLSKPWMALSVSSNGSTWVKPGYNESTYADNISFSILERIDVGETQVGQVLRARYTPFQYPRTDRRG